MEINICKISGVEYILTNTEDGGFELSPKPIVQIDDAIELTQSQPQQQIQSHIPTVNVPLIPQDLQDLFDNIPRSIPTLVKRYNSLTDFEKATLNKILRSGNNINHLLEFYLNNIYPSDYHYGIKFALAGLLQHSDGKVIFNKIKNGIPLSSAEENILDYGGHSGCSFGGLIYWLRTIFTKAQGDAFNNYHLVFDEGDFQRRHYLFLD